MATRARKTPQVRQVTTRQERERPSVFMRLKTDEIFNAYALFEPDPELEDNPGYYEYYDHWDQQANTYVPCAGEDCPFCKANNLPSTRAMTVWYFPKNKKGDQLKVFSMNYNTINSAFDESQLEEGMLGKEVRIKRQTDRGEYRVRITSAKPMLKKEISALMSDVEELDLPGMVNRQLAIQMERLKAVEALEEDEDEEIEEEEEEEKPRRRRGRALVREDEEEETEEEDEEDEEEAEEEDEEDEEEEDEEEPEAEAEDEEELDEGEEEGEEDTVITATPYEVVSTNANEETFSLKSTDGKRAKMWVNQGVDIDFEDFAKGSMVTVDAQQDDEGDWIITKIAKRRGRKPVRK